MELTKIKYNPDGPEIELAWETSLPTGATETHRLKSDDPARPGFWKILQALAPHFLVIMELPESYAPYDGSLVIRSVTLTRKDELRVTITAIKELSSGEVVAINTPHTSLLSGACRDAIEDVCTEARAYAQGRRATRDLFEESEDRSESFVESVTVEHAGKSVTMSGRGFDRAVKRMGVDFDDEDDFDIEDPDDDDLEEEVIGSYMAPDRGPK